MRRKATAKAARKSKAQRKTKSSGSLLAHIKRLPVQPIIHPKGFAPRPANTRWPAEIKIGKRHRKDYGDIEGLARSINDRGALIQPIPINESDTLIAGERRLKAWQHPICKFRGQPIPVASVTVDSIVAGEWDENAQRKDFTLEESVRIKRELEKVLRKIAKERQKSHGGTAPGRKGVKAEEFRVSQRAAAMTGKKRRTLEKAERVLDAATKDPERFGHLREAMNKTGKVDGPHKRLQIMLQTDALRKAPPPLPMHGPYSVIVIDYSWPGEKDSVDQGDLDRRGRAMRDYPEMPIPEGCKFFSSKEFQALMAPDCTVYFWTTNHHMDQAFELLRAMGFETERLRSSDHSTIGTWRKNKMGRGKVLRGKTEHCIIATRGDPVINLTNQTTDWCGPGWEVREDSRKPDAFFALVEELTPAPRYAEIFSREGRNEKWDCHGDQVGKFDAKKETGGATEDPCDIPDFLRRTPPAATVTAGENAG